jgi:hypothetical protein
MTSVSLVVRSLVSGPHLPETQDTPFDLVTAHLQTYRQAVEMEPIAMAGDAGRPEVAVTGQGFL